MDEVRQDWEPFGPDATFSAIANWLTKNVGTIDDFFAAAPESTHLRVSEEMTQAHRNIDHEQIIPRVDVAADHGGYIEGAPDSRARSMSAQLRSFADALCDRVPALKSRCVIREDILYQEVLDLTIWRGGAAFGMLRYVSAHAMYRPPEYELAEQFFSWLRRGDRYVGERLEIRLWGAYMPDFLAEGTKELREIKETPAKLLDSREIIPGRDTGYVALYQMQRPPSRIAVGRQSISVLYEGENEAARAALARADP